MDEPYCSQECYDAGGATITTTLLQGWSGDCSVCRQPLEIAFGTPGSMVCFKPGLFLYFHQEPACADAVTAKLSELTECVVCGKKLDRADSGFEQVVANVSQARMFIQDAMGTEYWKLAQQISSMHTLGQLHSYQEPDARKALIDEPADRIIKMIERASGLPDDQVRRVAAITAQQAVHKWSLEKVPDVLSYQFLSDLSRIYKCKDFVNELIGVCADAFLQKATTTTDA
jgi:hypothetical protein